MRLAKIAYKKEPVLHVHRYVVLIHYVKPDGTKTHYHYCDNLKDVRAHIKSEAQPGDIVEVFKAQHNFVQAYERVR